MRGNRGRGNWNYEGYSSENRDMGRGQGYDMRQGYQPIIGMY